MSTPLRERPDAPLGTLIFRAGLLPAETIENALEEGVKTGRRLGEILIERGLLQEEDLTRLLAGQKGLPFVNLRTEPIDPEATRLLSEDQARLFSALPIRFEEGLPLVAVADPTNDVLNRNIREALGQDVRFVVAGRTELNEVIGEAYSGTLRAVAPAPEPAIDVTPEPEPEPELDATPLRVDTSVPPAAEEPSLPAYEPEPQPEQEPDPEAEPDPELVFEAPVPEPTFEAPEPEPVFEEAAPAYEEAAPAYEEAAPVDDAAPAVEAEPDPEPEPVLEPAATFDAPAPATEFEPPAPAYEAPSAPEPVAPLATEPVAPQSLPETNGQAPHDLEDDLLPPEPAAPVADPVPAETAPEEPAPAALNGSGFTVSVRLTSGERLTVSDCADMGEAKGYAKALTKQLGTTDPDDWPFVNGRFLKPDTIISVDIEPS
jgi:Type II secretion system (T2SS), protein E, N-terminal domain